MYTLVYECIHLFTIVYTCIRMYIPLPLPLSSSQLTHPPFTLSLNHLLNKPPTSHYPSPFLLH